jgi:60 kDa SS-A/Ro ribonucleoprotein
MNKNVFSTKSAPAVHVPDAVNEAGGKAYSLSDTGALAQYAMTGTFQNTFYASAEDQTAKVMELASKVSPEDLAMIAVYSRKSGFMKDMPAVLLAVLLARSKNDLKTQNLFRAASFVVLDDMKMIRNFCNAVRSGVTGRKSFGTLGKKAIQRALERMTAQQLFNGSIGNDPTLADIMRMVHPRFNDVERNNMVRYLMGHEFSPAVLPETVRHFEEFKKNPKGTPPAVNFQFLSSVKMSETQWAELAQTMSWHTLRMNLNTLLRNGAFNVPDLDTQVASILRDKETLGKIKVFPYQLLAAYMNSETTMPKVVTNALQQAMETATKNVPVLNGKTLIAIDVSGSMGSPVTGSGAVYSKVRCVDAAALMGASVLRTNPDARVWAFHDSVVVKNLNPMDSVMTNTEKIFKTPGGGTDCAAVLRKLNAEKSSVDTIVMVSDNMSWISFTTGNSWYNSQTNMKSEWDILKKRCPKAKMVLIDIQPGTTTQVADDKDVLNVGGFSDNVFEVVAAFANGDFGNGDHYIKAIRASVSQNYPGVLGNI